MATEADPVVGNWYQHLDKGYKFEVVAVDDDKGLVEVQHFDGDVEEIDVDTWYEMDIEAIEAPENWSGPMDSFEEDALDYTETDMDEDDWEAPLGELEPPPLAVRKRVTSPLDESLEEAPETGEDTEEYSDRFRRDED